MTRLTAATAYLSLALFMAASQVSMHLHVMPDGRVTVHSHAAPRSETPHGHNHDAHEYAFLCALSHTLDSGSATQMPSLSFFPVIRYQAPAAQQLPDLDSGQFEIHDRAPPSLAC